ncbi:alpha/beta hydrolase [Persephonella sp.]|uniref:alpha/beta fold hydrolase n=1 Tax=Persephonella sp. TaxID=2060922 RepID=UPI0025D5DD3D|nr:alpha/beta hydrolase [Persephonella sp.]
MRSLKINKIFIHGWSFSSKIWEGFKNVPDSYFLELPFHGDNREYADNNIIEKFSDQLCEKINSSNKETALIGWSLGASVSMLTALKKPEKLKKLILIGFSPKFMDKKLGHNPVFVKAFMMALKIDFQDTVYNFRKTAVGNPYKNIPLPEKEGSIKLLREFINLDLTERLEDIEIPVFMIHGKKDRIINYQASIYANEKIKNSHLILTQSHHAPFLEDKTLITNLL